MTSLKTNELTFVEKPLFTPTFEEVKSALENGLKSNFSEVNVHIVNAPPNLQNAPFHLAATGLCGSPTLIEIGGAPYLLPLVDRSKLYDLKEICQKILKNTDILAIGAGAGPHTYHNTNCEGIFNMKINANGSVQNESHTARVDTNSDETCILEKLPNSETKCALLANIFLCEGKPGKLLHVQCKHRIGSNDFIASIRKSLLNNFTDNKTIGLGGVFILKAGTAKQHVMRDFSKTPLNSEVELNEWLKFFNMPATLIAVGTLVTDEADLDLRLQHFHSFSKNGWGGHYHIDTTPDIVEYEGYFNIAEKIIRIDQPIVTHKYGRD